MFKKSRLLQWLTVHRASLVLKFHDGSYNEEKYVYTGSCGAGWEGDDNENKVEEHRDKVIEKVTLEICIQ